jgi:cytochrome P450
MEPAVHTVWSYPFGEPDRLRLHPRYASLRAHRPLARVRMPHGDPAWLVTGYDNARTVLADPRFSRAYGRDEPRITRDLDHTGLMSTDPPEHTRLRRLVAKAFTAPRVERLRPRVRRLTEELVDAMTGAGTPADLVAGLAVPLPLLLICELLGIPHADRERIPKWARMVVSATALSPARKREYQTRLGVYMTRSIKDHRRRGSRAGLLDTLIQARDGNRINEDELVRLSVDLLAMGFENTATQLANFVYTLLTEPYAWDELRARPHLVPTAVEELSRYVPIATFAEFPRYATEDVELDGGVVRAGEAVLVCVAAADRDERVFTDPERLDLRRQPNPHLAFSHGVHHCLGAPLARMELQVCLETLISRLPTLKLAVTEEEVPWKTGLLVRGPEALPVTW